MNNSNFGYDYRNNFDNCKFVPIFDEYREITFMNRYHNIFDPKVSKFVTSDLLKKQIAEEYNDKLMKLDKGDKIYEIKLQTLKAERLSSLEAAEKIDEIKKENKRRATLIDYAGRKKNKRRATLIDYADRRNDTYK